MVLTTLPTVPTPCIIGLAGGSGSGKTTLAAILETALPWEATVLGLDQFYRDLSHLSMEERRDVNFDDPTMLDLNLAAEAVEQLQRGIGAQIPIYDFAGYNRTQDTITLSPAPIIIVEGMYALEHAPLVELYDIAIFLDVDEATRWERKLERDIQDRGRTYDQALTMWERYTKPMHNQFVQPTKQRATMVFNDSFAPQVIEALTSNLRGHMALEHAVTAE